MKGKIGRRALLALIAGVTYGITGAGAIPSGSRPLYATVGLHGAHSFVHYEDGTSRDIGVSDGDYKAAEVFRQFYGGISSWQVIHVHRFKQFGAVWEPCVGRTFWGTPTHNYDPQWQAGRDASWEGGKAHQFHSLSPQLQAEYRAAEETWLRDSRRMPVPGEEAEREVEYNRMVQDWYKRSGHLITKSFAENERERIAAEAERDARAEPDPAAGHPRGLADIRLADDREAARNEVEANAENERAAAVVSAIAAAPAVARIAAQPAARPAVALPVVQVRTSEATQDRAASQAQAPKAAYSVSADAQVAASSSQSTRVEAPKSESVVAPTPAAPAVASTSSQPAAVAAPAESPRRPAAPMTAVHTAHAAARVSSQQAAESPAPRVAPRSAIEKPIIAATGIRRSPSLTALANPRQQAPGRMERMREWLVRQGRRLAAVFSRAQRAPGETGRVPRHARHLKADTSRCLNRLRE